MSATDDGGGGARAGSARLEPTACGTREDDTHATLAAAAASRRRPQRRRNRSCSTPSSRALPRSGDRAGSRRRGSSRSTPQATAHRAGACARRAGLACAAHAGSGRGGPRARSRPASAQRVEFVERVPLDRWFEAFITPVALGGRAGRPRIVLVTFHDLTPLRRVEEMRADFVANASHELRTPLAALLRLHRDAAGPGARRSGGARALPRHHAGAGLAHGAADRRPAVAVAHRARAHMRPDTPVDLVADRAPGGRRLADAGDAIAASRSRSRRRAEPLDRAGRPRRAHRACSRIWSRTRSNTAPAASASTSRCRRGDRVDGKPEARVAVRDYGPGIARRASAAPDRALLSRRRRRQPRPRRHRAGPRAGQAHPQSPPRPADDREQATARARRSRCGCRWRTRKSPLK